jgi:hypothetical protein
VGQAADDKVREIEQTRERLDSDLRELERRMPPVRQAKRIAGVLAGSGLAAGFLLRLRGKRKEQQARFQEVVVRVVVDDDHEHA